MRVIEPRRDAGQWSTGRQAVRDNQAINLLRTMAAFAVVLNHFRSVFFLDSRVADRDPFVLALYHVSGLGRQAVIVFFVLSGYWVGGAVLTSVQQHRFRLADYAIKRLVRLWIVLLPALALTAILDTSGRAWFASSSVYQGDPGLSPPFPMDLDARLTIHGVLGNIIFLQELHVPPFGTNTPLWSLAYEFWYYAMFPCILLAVRRSSSLRLRLGCAAGFFVAAAICGTDVLILFPTWLLGVVVAHHRSSVQRAISQWPTWLLPVARVAATSALVAVLAVSSSRWFDHRVHLKDAGVALVTAGLLSLLIHDLTWQGLPGRLLRRLSNCAHGSYSLYAIHEPIVALACAAIVGRAEHRWPPDAIHLAAGGALLLSMVVVAWGFAACTELRTDQVRAAIGRRWATRG
jgi:peptidoglycan/LPS O-acetylase OafA/YrhL